MAQGLPNKINLEIVAPDRLLFSGEVDEVVVPGAEGALGILPGHAPLISQLEVGVITYKAEGRETRLFCGWGFVEVLGDKVSVLAEKAHHQKEIDVEAARADLARAENLLKSKDPRTDYASAGRLYCDAVARLETVEG